MPRLHFVESILFVCFLTANVIVSVSSHSKFGAIVKGHFDYNSIHSINSPFAVQHRNPLSNRIQALKVRGGETAKAIEEDLADSEEDFSEDEDFLSDEEDYFEDEAATVADDDFKEESYLKRIILAWNKTPPLTMSYISTSVIITMASWLLNKNEWPSILFLDWAKATKGLQFWRFFTAFLSFGEFGLNYVLTAQFVWTYMANLEKLSCKEPENFLMMSLFGMVSLLVSYAVMNFNTAHLGHNLSAFFVYVWSRTYEGQDVQLFNFFELKAELLPWFFIVQGMIFEGQVPYTDIVGIGIGHLYHYLKLKKMINAPGFVKDMLQHPILRSRYAVYEEEFGGF